MCFHQVSETVVEGCENLKWWINVSLGLVFALRLFVHLKCYSGLYNSMLHFLTREQSMTAPVHAISRPLEHKGMALDNPPTKSEGMAFRMHMTFCGT